MKRVLFMMSLLSLAINSYAYDFNLKNIKSNVVSIEEVCRSDFFKELKNVPKDEMDDFLFENWNPNKIVQFKKGIRLPLKIFLKGEFFHLMIDKYHYPQIIIEKDLFIKIQDRKFLFSQDLKNWEKAVSFFKGDAKIEVGSYKGIPKITVGAELNKK